MTLTWDILNNGDLALWFWEQDPLTDEPLAVQQTSGGWSWSSDGGRRDFPPEVLDLCYQAAADYYADVQTVDYNLFRFALEVACEQIERR